jgi:uncharacterized protein
MPMTDQRSPTAPRHHPKLGINYDGYHPSFCEELLRCVDYVEVTPDALAAVRGDRVVLDERAMAQLREIASAATIVVHGIGLSIGSHDGYCQDYLRLLDQFLDRADVAWHSEHLGYTTVDGMYLGTMFALPRTEETLDIICERIRTIQARYPLPFLLENIVHLIPDCGSNYSEAEFLNAITSRTGCGLLLDVYNLECDAQNHDLDVQEFFAQLDLRAVRELHVARGVEHEGFLLDVHSGLVHDSTIALAYQIIGDSEATVEVVTYELLREAIPILGIGTIADELRRLACGLCG